MEKQIIILILFLLYYIQKGGINNMEQVMKHYGNAILAVIVLLALGAILVAALSSDGYIATEFKNALTGFFSSMNALRG